MDNAYPNIVNDSRKESYGMTGGEWLDLICRSTEKDLLEIIKRQPALIEKTIGVDCLAANVNEKCNCCYEFESLKHLKVDICYLLSLVKHGMCPHVPNASTIDRPETTSPREISPDHPSSRAIFQDKIKINNMKFYSQETEVSKNIETRSYEANNEYKFREPLDFNLLRQAWMSLFLPRDRVMEDSGIVKAGVTVIHIAAALGYSKLVRTIQKIGYQSSYSTLHYQLLPMYHSIIYFKVDVTKLLIEILDFVNKANFTRYYVLAVMRNCIPILSVFVKCVGNLKHQYIPSYYFVCMNYQKQLGSGIAVRYKCHKSLEYLCSKASRRIFACQIGVSQIEGIPYMEWMEETDIRTMSIDNDIRSLRCLLKLSDILGNFLRSAVFYDRKDMAKILISEMKQRARRRCYTGYNINCLTLAVINNSPEMLQILLDGYKCFVKSYAKRYRYREYTSHTWAVVLGFQDCVNVLQKTDIPYQEDTVARFPPLVAVFQKDVDSHVNNRLKLINILLSNGWSLSCESDNGFTPLFMALESELYEFVRPLLKFGIDPFIGINCLPAFICRRFLGELLYANVDIFERRHGVSLLREILYWNTTTTYRELRSDLCFLLRNAHTIPKEDLAYLYSARELPNIPETLLNDIDDFLNTPRTLEALSRDSLRRHYGLGITCFLTNQVPDLPQKIKSIIMLEECLQQYLGESFKKNSRGVFRF